MVWAYQAVGVNKPSAEAPCFTVVPDSVAPAFSPIPFFLSFLFSRGDPLECNLNFWMGIRLLTLRTISVSQRQWFAHRMNC